MCCVRIFSLRQITVTLFKSMRIQVFYLVAHVEALDSGCSLTVIMTVT